jgi:UDP-4-amino-4,6-dideoxy-N-acetyl-beta-L-altrosamine transaminase
MIPYGRQDIDEADIQAVLDVLKSDFLTQGPVVPRFEQAVAKECDALHALAMNSATSALHVACLALGLGPGDWLWTSPITFVASANCGLYCGANVDFVDIDPQTYNMSPAALEEKLIAAEKTGRLPKIVVPVHLCGQSADMQAISALSERYGFHVIEDASHAIGGQYQSAPIGNCRYSDITVFSFHPVKIITTAEGGMALTNSAELAQRMALFRSHGITRDEKLMTHTPDGPWYYQQLELGYNYRMTELQAALGLSQLARLHHFVAKRHQIARHYDEAFTNTGIITPWQHPESYSGLHLYVIRVPTKKDKGRLQIFEHLRTKGIAVNVHYIPVHLQPYYRRLGFKTGDFPEAEKYYSEAISLPMFYSLSEIDQNHVIQVAISATYS